MVPQTKARRFRVALSYPGEKREYVQLVAKSLAAALGEEQVLYDGFITAELVRLDMDVYLGNLYRNESDLLIPFFCSEYAAKKWCQLEWRQMRDILFNMERSRIMPCRFDNTPIEGVLSVDNPLEIGSRTPDEVAKLILKRLELLNPPEDKEKKYRVFISKLPTVNTLLVGRDEQIKF